MASGQLARDGAGPRLVGGGHVDVARKQVGVVVEQAGDDAAHPAELLVRVAPPDVGDTPCGGLSLLRQVDQPRARLLGEGRERAGREADVKAGKLLGGVAQEDRLAAREAGKGAQRGRGEVLGVVHVHVGEGRRSPGRLPIENPRGHLLAQAGTQTVEVGA